MVNYDVIIIGSGIGGSGVGAILAFNKLKILLLEKNDFVGGRCTTFRKKGFDIDFGVHLFANSNKGPLQKVAKLAGVSDKITWITSKSQSIQRTNNHKRETPWIYKGRFWRFPEDMHKILSSAESNNLSKLLLDIMKIKKTSEFNYLSIKDYLLKYTKNELIHSFFGNIAIKYFGVPYYEASAGELIECFKARLINQSSGYPKGGCISIPLAYTEAIIKNNGKIEFNTPVKKILIKNNKVYGVLTENNKEIKSNIIISNAGIKETINNLVDNKFLPLNYIKYINNLKYTISALVLKLPLRNAITNLKCFTTISFEDPDRQIKTLLKGKIPDEIQFFATVPSNYDPEITPKGNQLIIAGTPVITKKFEKNKKQWIKIFMKSLENYLPGLSENLLWREVITPYNIERLMDKEGTAIGVSQSIYQVGNKRPKIETPIEGLYIVGCDTGKSWMGGELAAQSAIECSSKVLQFFEKLKTV